MASSQLSIIFAVLAIFVPLVLAKQYTVGDNGWAYMIDYDAWTKGKQFAVGDTLLFKYAEGAHNVVEVKEDEYAQCKASPTAKELTSGQDVIKLDAPGKRYFICTIGKHCVNKQKIAITVGSSSSSSGPAAGPTASSPDASSPASSVTDSTTDASSPTESGSSVSSATKSGLGGLDDLTKPIAPAPGPHNSAATIGGRYGWMVILSGIIGFLIA
ncbi:hypothetical protein ACLB2K_043495 [Fragaria x ananassa]